MHSTLLPHLFVTNESICIIKMNLSQININFTLMQTNLSPTKIKLMDMKMNLLVNKIHMSEPLIIDTSKCYYFPNLRDWQQFDKIKCNSIFPMIDKECTKHFSKKKIECYAAPNLSINRLTAYRWLQKLQVVPRRGDRLQRTRQKFPELCKFV